MRVAVLGCGAIGGLFLGYLFEKDIDVYGVVREYQKVAFSQDGLVIEGARGSFSIKPGVDTRLTKKVDIAIFATKINDLENIVKENIDYLRDALVFTTQNGVRADYILREYFSPRQIITGIVMFGATLYSPNTIVHNFEGDVIAGTLFDAQSHSIRTVTDVVSNVFNTVYLENIEGAKYLKIFINLNNCIPAVLGMSMQEAFSDLDIARLAIQLNREAYEVVQKSNIVLESLPSYSKERLHGLVSMRINEAAQLFSQIMTSLSKAPLYGSILQSIKRGKKSEIDYINGEIVQCAQENGIDASLNKEMVSLVHQVEEQGQFLSKEELLKSVNTGIQEEGV